MEFQFSSAQRGVCALGKALMRFAPNLRRFPKVGFATVPLVTWTHVTAIAAYRKAMECEGGGWDGGVLGF